MVGIGVGGGSRRSGEEEVGGLGCVSMGCVCMRACACLCSCVYMCMCLFVFMCVYMCM